MRTMLRRYVASEPKNTSWMPAQHTSAYVKHTSAYVKHPSAYVKHQVCGERIDEHVVHACSISAR
jgi:hypothetical protein